MFSKHFYILTSLLYSFLILFLIFVLLLGLFFYFIQFFLSGGFRFNSFRRRAFLPASIFCSDFFFFFLFVFEIVGLSLSHTIFLLTFPTCTIFLTAAYFLISLSEGFFFFLNFLKVPFFSTFSCYFQETCYFLILIFFKIRIFLHHADKCRPKDIMVE